MSGLRRPARGGVTVKMTTSPELYEAERDVGLTRPFDIQSYDDLLQFPDVPVSTIDSSSGERAITESLVDAIVVPTIRSAEHLYPALQLATQARCHLIAVYTDAPPAGISAVLAGLPPVPVTLLSVRAASKDRLLDLGASLPQSLVSPQALDISRKRNLGLLIGHVCGWQRMIFLDDDIRKLSVAKLSSAAALLDHYPVVGLQVKKYPDASVVGHARRLTGRRQEPFISGGSLLVNPQRLNGYFAPVYHEDWLCVINHLHEGAVAIGGSVGQLPYLPFATPERGRFEEFGDILLSGLLWLVHAHTRNGAAEKSHLAADNDYWREATNPRFWKHILEQRAELLADITVRLTGKNFDGPSPLPSLAGARQRLSELRPADFVSFTEKWLTSLGEWRARLSELPRIELAGKERDMDKVLAELGLAHVVCTHEACHWRSRRWRGGPGPGGRARANGRRMFGMPSWF
jgi:hypothetical protein